MTVTATQGGAKANGMMLAVLVLTGAKAAASQTGATASSATVLQASITTTAAGSYVVGGAPAAPGTYTVNGITTQLGNANVSSTQLMTGRQATATGTPGAETIGWSTTTACALALAEILASGTIAFDGSAPAVATAAAETITSASFTPPPGSLLVAIVASDGTTGTLTMSVSGGSLTWTLLKSEAPSGGGGTFIYVADIAPASGSDTGAGADSASLAAALAGTDTGSGADAGTLAAAVAPADTGSGADTAAVLIPVSGADAGSGADSASVAVAPVFPQSQLGIGIDLDLGAWTDVTGYAVQPGTPVAVAIQRGRTDEQSSATQSTAAVQFNNVSGQFSPRNPLGPWYGQLGRNTTMRVSIPDPGGTYLRLADDDTSYASCPDSAGLQITGDMDIRILVSLDDHRACVLASKYGTTALGWALALNGDGTLTFTWHSGSSDVQASSTAGLTVPLGLVLIRVTLAVSSGTVTFFTGSAMGAGTQLGSAVVSGSTSVAAAAGQAVAVGYSAQYAGVYGPAGCLGKVLELQVRSGIGGTVKADPVFSAQPAAASSFADGQGNTWSVAGSAELSDRAYRFHGQLAALPQIWDLSGTDVWAPVSAAGVLRWTAQGQSPVPSAIKRAVLQQVASLVAYWPGEDGQAASQLGSALPGGYPMALGSPYGSAELANDSFFLCSAPLPDVNGSQWTGVVPRYQTTGQLAIRFLTYAAKPVSALPLVIDFYFEGATGYTAVEFVWSIDPADPLENGMGTEPFQGGTSPGGTACELGAIGSVEGPTWGTGYAVSIELTYSGGSVTPALNAIGTDGSSWSNTGSSWSTSMGRLVQVVVNPEWGIAESAVSSPLAVWAVGHIHAQTTITPLSDLAGPLAAWRGETAATRFARLCGENGIGARIYGYPLLSAAMGPQTQGTLQDLLTECETADMGLIAEPRQCLGLGYRTLKSMTAQDPAVTLAYDEDSLAIRPTDDDAHSRNDITVTRGSLSGSQGSSVQVVLDDGSPMSVSPPPAGIGDYSTTQTVNVQHDADLGDVAGWLLHVGTADEERYPSIPLDMASADPYMQALLPAIAGLDSGDYVAISGLPAWMPPGDAKQLVYGYSEAIGDFAWQMVLNGVPETPYEVGIVGDPVYGHADTDGSTLHADITSTATTMQADSAGIIWTTAAGDFPFDISMGGEQITVTNITGSSSPQTFTVVRSVNGVVKAHTAGESLSLTYPAILAIA